MGDEFVVSNERPKYKLIDLFAGAGGLSNGFTQTEYFKIVGAVEINKAAIETYIENHGRRDDIIIKPDDSDCSDITKIDFKKFIDEKNIDGDETIVIGGPPCQGFSNANRQKNYLISGNNQLVKEFARAIDEIKPAAFLMENVKAMSSAKHKFFVTQNCEDKRFKYSSEEHLVKLKSDDKPIWVEDKICLIQTDDSKLMPIIRGIVEKNVSKPIIESEKYLSRIRSLERKVKKQKAYQLTTVAEIKECYDLVNYLRLRKRENKQLYSELGIVQILENAITTFEHINARAIDQDEFQNEIGRLKELNMFMLHLKEIKDENIKVINEKLEISFNEAKNKLTVNAPVLSYNIVNYLLAFFESIGYKLDSDVLNAADYGVPQNRQRFMILGVKKEEVKLKEVKLPLKFEWLAEPFTTKAAIGDLEDIDPIQDMKAEEPVYNYVGGESNLLKYYQPNKNGKIYNHINTDSRSLSRKRFEHIKNQGGKNFHSLPDELKDNTYANSARTQNTIYLRLDYSSPSNTVVNIRKSMWNHPERSRALSVREAARLQSFKDDFVFKGTKDQQYQQVGNAVPPLLARAVAEQMLRLLGKEPIKSIKDELGF